MLALSNRVVPIVPRPLAVSGSVSSNTVVSTSVAGADANASDTLHWRRFGGTLVLGFLLRGRRGGVLCIVLSCLFFFWNPYNFFDKTKRIYSVLFCIFFFTLRLRGQRSRCGSEERRRGAEKSLAALQEAFPATWQAQMVLLILCDSESCIVRYRMHHA